MQPSSTTLRTGAFVAALIDHTLLRADATRSEIETVCQEALQHGFASVCVNGCWVRLVADQLRGSVVKTCTVVGFPLGAMATAAKLAETQVALQEGAQEVDMVLNIGALCANETGLVSQEIATLADECHQQGALLKVILETALLDEGQKRLACELSRAAGADFVKTSTGFAKSGATAEDVALMRSVVGLDLGVKASGGIRTLADLQRMVQAGATRIGASASVAIVAEQAR